MFRKIESEFTSRSDEELHGGEDLKLLCASTIGRMGPKWDVHLPVFLSPASFARLLWLDTLRKSPFQPYSAYAVMGE
jgi:hypothetical protein